MSVTVNETVQHVTITEDNMTVTLTGDSVSVVQVAGGITGVGVAKMTVSATQPSNPTTGDIWIAI